MNIPTSASRSPSRSVDESPTYTTREEEEDGVEDVGESNPNDVDEEERDGDESASSSLSSLPDLLSAILFSRAILSLLATAPGTGRSTTPSAFTALLQMLRSDNRLRRLDLDDGSSSSFPSSPDASAPTLSSSDSFKASTARRTLRRSAASIRGGHQLMLSTPRCHPSRWTAEDKASTQPGRRYAAEDQRSPSAEESTFPSRGRLLSKSTDSSAAGQSEMPASTPLSLTPRVTSVEAASSDSRASSSVSAVVPGSPPPPPPPPPSAKMRVFASSYSSKYRPSRTSNASCLLLLASSSSPTHDDANRGRIGVVSRTVHVPSKSTTSQRRRLWPRSSRRSAAVSDTAAAVAAGEGVVVDGWGAIARARRATVGDHSRANRVGVMYALL
mmetsp:Transcript_9268/g.27940  ORF Transcript_9268/g.27940 Transcript_9268/m.27940 type:complete len:386 (+) Transcript_9268:871-2028(+)